MGQFSDQLKKYFEETPKEEIDRHFFEFECDWYHIDKNDPHAKRKIKRKHLKEKWQRRLPKIKVVIDACCAYITLMSAGLSLGYKCWGLAFFNTLTGIFFLYKLISDAKELYWE